MTKLQALKKSCEKWDAIYAGTGVDLGSDDCALCKQYYACAGCPVALMVNDVGCKWTPWIEWSDHHRQIHDYNRSDKSLVDDCKTCEKLAFKEAMFLYDLYIEELLKGE